MISDRLYVSTTASDAAIVAKRFGLGIEIAEFCNIAPFYVPCIDFGHVNARTNGSLKTTQDFLDVLNLTEQVAGRDKLEKLHIHFSLLLRYTSHLRCFM